MNMTESERRLEFFRLAKIEYDNLAAQITEEQTKELEQYPHLFVLGCAMNRGIPYEKAWDIPKNIARDLGDSLEFSTFQSVSKDEYLRLFTEKNYHRYKNKMAVVFYKAVQRIAEK
jgi:hypothetical protein